jgi:protein-L-isoaspartate(D-aspartate) O-methyltransferase
MLARLREQGIRDEVTLSAMGSIARHIFVDEALSSRAYEDVSLPIGFGQTISQPYIVARMTEILRAGKPLGNVLEIGTGCGYQTAVLSKVAKEVYSVERIRPLLMKARGHLRELRMSNIKLKHADGTMGLSEMAPFDGIIVTAAASHVPQELLEQLAVGGRMVIPVGTEEQILYLIEHVATTNGSEYRQTKLEPVKFVPLLGGTN